MAPYHESHQDFLFLCMVDFILKYNIKPNKTFKQECSNSAEHSKDEYVQPKLICN